MDNPTLPLAMKGEVTAAQFCCEIENMAIPAGTYITVHLDEDVPVTFGRVTVSYEVAS